MSVQAMTRVMEQSQTTGMTRLVLLVIANHESEDRGAFPSIDRIAADARCSRRAAQAGVARAAAMGELAVDRNAGPHGTNVYRVLVGVSVQHLDMRGAESAPRADVRPESAPERKERSSSSSTNSQNLRRDLIFEAVMEVSGIDLGEIPDEARGGYNRAVAGLRKLGATPAEIAVRARRAWFKMTPAALLRHWAELGPARTNGHKATALDPETQRLVDSGVLRER